MGIQNNVKICDFILENGIKLLYGLMQDWGNRSTLQLLNYDKN